MSDNDYKYTRIPPRLTDDLWAVVKSEGQQVSYSQGEFLYHQNSISPGIFCIESGKVKVFQITGNATETILRIVTEGSLLGEASTFDGAESSPAAIALSPVTAYILTKEKASGLIRTNGDFALFFVHSLVHKLKAQSDQLEKISGEKVLRRLASILCTLEYYGIPQDEEGWFNITQTELAGIVSTTRPNMTVLLNRLRDKDLVEIKRNMIRITDRARLEDLSASDV